MVIVRRMDIFDTLDCNFNGWEIDQIIEFIVKRRDDHNIISKDIRNRFKLIKVLIFLRGIAYFYWTEW